MGSWEAKLATLGFAPCRRSRRMQSRFPEPVASYNTVSPLVACAVTSPPGGDEKHDRWLHKSLNKSRLKWCMRDLLVIHIWTKIRWSFFLSHKGEIWLQCHGKKVFTRVFICLLTSILPFVLSAFGLNKLCLSVSPITLWKLWLRKTIF